MRRWEIRELTLPEIAMALDDEHLDKPRAPAGSVNTGGSPEARAEYAKWLASLTPLQRMELARDGKVTSQG